MTGSEPSAAQPWMRLRFWGVRGVHASAGPQYVRYGGNTSALEVELDCETGAPSLRVLFDFGTGAIGLGRKLLGDGFGAGKGRLLVLLTSTQLDHTGALPFFVPLFIPGNHIALYGASTADQTPRELLEDLLDPHYSPINSLNNFGASLQIAAAQEGRLHVEGLRPDQSIDVLRLGDAQEASLAFRLNSAGRSVAIVGDAAWRSPAMQDAVVQFAANVDVLLHNSAWIERFTPPLTGLCPHMQAVVRLAERCGAGQLVLTHHSPYSTDAHLDELQQRLSSVSKPRVVVGHEGLVLQPA